MSQTTLQQQAQEHESIVVIRPSFKKISGGGSCRAALLNHVLYWVARKQSQGKEYWYSTGEGLYHDLGDTWGITQVRSELKALVSSGLIGEMKNPRMKIDRTKHFFFGISQASTFFAKCATEKVCMFCIGLAKEVTTMLTKHLMLALNALPDKEAFDAGVKCICAQHQKHLIPASHHLMQLSNPFDAFIKAITQVSTQDYYSDPSNELPDYVENDSSSAHADDTSHAYEKGLQPQGIQIRSDSQPFHCMTQVCDLSIDALNEIAERLVAGAVHEGVSDDTTPHDNCVRTDRASGLSHARGEQAQEVSKEPGCDTQALASSVFSDCSTSTDVYAGNTSSVAPTGGSTTETTHMNSIAHGMNTSTMAAREAALQAKSTTDYPTPEHATMADADSLPPANVTNACGKNKKVVEVPLVMPADDAPWNAETLVQALEARQGRRYPNGAKRKSDRIRDKELAAASDLVDLSDIWTIDTAENIRRLVKIVTHLETRRDGWWLENVGRVMPHHLSEKDRIHAMVDEMKRQKQTSKSLLPSQPTRYPDNPLPAAPANYGTTSLFLMERTQLNGKALAARH